MTAQSTDFATLLQTATTTPGTISKAYTTFYGYSLGNQLLALGQCAARGLELGPIATYNKWRELGRQVSKGSKALALCMPVTGKTTDKETGEDATYTRFIFRNNWFVLAQTEGAEYVAPPLPAWDRARALSTLDISEQPFAITDGNAQGYARERIIAINPVAANPYKTTFHELAHILLGHTAEGSLSDDDRTPRDLREVEAEATAMLCCAALELPGLDDARGYIQHWYGQGSEIPEASARKIFKTADAILKAGRPAEKDGDA